MVAQVYVHQGTTQGDCALKMCQRSLSKTVYFNLSMSNQWKCKTRCISVLKFTFEDCLCACMWVPVSLLIGEKSVRHMTIQNRLFHNSLWRISALRIGNGILAVPRRSGRNTLVVQIKDFSRSLCGSSPVQLFWPLPAETKTKGLRIDLRLFPVSIWSQKKRTCMYTWMWEFSGAWPTSVDLVIVTKVNWVGQERHNSHEMHLYNLI